ncbi:unnamed protein product [Peniophora sp. CBMAI 1063]|nr:unnamed protein product [Peniophora sp. CBMAI 1063]
MAGYSAHEVIVLSSSGDEDMGSGAEEDSWSEGPDAPQGSESEDDPLFPPVEPAQGSEDDESSSNGGAESVEGDGDVDMESPAASPSPDVAPPQAPHIPRRQPYIMNHNTASLPLPVNVPVPPAFSRAGLQNSAHFNQFLRHLRDSSVPAPPYSEHMSGLQAAIGVQLSVAVQREADNLETWRSLLAATESEILELDRLQFIITRMATSPLLRAAAAVQGADLTIPQSLLDRTAAPPPDVTYGVDEGDSTDSPAPEGAADQSHPPPGSAASLQPGDAADEPHPPPGTAVSSGEPDAGGPASQVTRRRAFVADLRPVSFVADHEEPLPLEAANLRRAGSVKKSRATGQCVDANPASPLAGPSRLGAQSGVAQAPSSRPFDRAPTPGPSSSTADRPAHTRRRSRSRSPSRRSTGRHGKKQRRAHDGH